MNITQIIKTISLVGSDLPAYKALFDTIVATFNEKDQATLKASYEEALTRADEAHRKAQAL